MSSTKNLNPRQWTTWFEIAVTDYDRAKKFYEAVFETQIEDMDFGPLKMGIFPHENVGCAICLNPFYVPSENGTLVYMNGGEDLRDAQNRIEPAGGKIVVPKKQISPEHGYMCVFIDSEGNRMALHSMK